ncbi:hypothetical protein AB1L88_02010 [Tautonia sp. JC769]|uniref:hypothetical protein n=1 Tax=Tautonia sp. JC769 TaxID=3232135 RepID=UPI003459C499
MSFARTILPLLCIATFAVVFPASLRAQQSAPTRASISGTFHKADTTGAYRRPDRLELADQTRVKYGDEVRVYLSGSGQSGPLAIANELDGQQVRLTGWVGSVREGSDSMGFQCYIDSTEYKIITLADSAETSDAKGEVSRLFRSMLDTIQEITQSRTPADTEEGFPVSRPDAVTDAPEAVDQPVEAPETLETKPSLAERLRTLNQHTSYRATMPQNTSRSERAIEAIRGMKNLEIASDAFDAPGNSDRSFSIIRSPQHPLTVSELEKLQEVGIDLEPMQQPKVPVNVESPRIRINRPPGSR